MKRRTKQERKPETNAEVWWEWVCAWVLEVVARAKRQVSQSLQHSKKTPPARRPSLSAGPCPFETVRCCGDALRVHLSPLPHPVRLSIYTIRTHMHKKLLTAIRVGARKGQMKGTAQSALLSANIRLSTLPLHALPTYVLYTPFHARPCGSSQFGFHTISPLVLPACIILIFNGSLPSADCILHKSKQPPLPLKGVFSLLRFHSLSFR
jgi:hypothetical protein